MALIPLAADFADNFRVETQNNPEMLFAIQSYRAGQEKINTHVIYTTPRPWGGWDSPSTPTRGAGLIDEFEEGESPPGLPPFISRETWWI